MSVAQQLGDEIASRLSPVCLLSRPVALQAIAETREASLIWAKVLADPEAGERAARDVYEALWPSPPPPDWWATDVGRVLAGFGSFDPDSSMSATAAQRLLGWTKHRVAKELGAPPYPTRAVLDAMVGD